MPVERCSVDGKPGYRWCKEGKCYAHTSGDEEARQGSQDPRW